MTADDKRIEHFESKANENDFFVIDGETVVIFHELDNGTIHKCILTHESVEQLTRAYEKFKTEG